MNFLTCNKRHNAPSQMDNYKMYFLVLVLLLLCLQATARPSPLQISKELYEQLPIAARPADRFAIKAKELITLIHKIDQFNLPGKIRELDSLCYNAAQQYVYLDTQKEQCDYIDAILQYYYYRYRGAQPDFVLRYSDTLLGVIGKSQKFNTIKFNLYLHRANIFIVKGQFIDAYNCYQEARQLGEQENNIDQIASAHGGLYIFYMHLMAYDKAFMHLDNYWHYLNQQKTSPLLQEQQYYLMFKGEGYLILYRDTKNMAYLDSAASFLSLIHYDSIYSVYKKEWIVRLSELAYHSGKFEQSIFYANLAGKLKTMTDDYFDDTRNAWKGLSLLKTGRIKEGLSLLKIIDLNNLAPPTDIVLETLSKYYQQNGLYEETLDIQGKILRYEKNAILNKNRLLAFEIEQKYDLDSKRKQIVFLKERSIKNTWLSVFIILSISLLLLILILRTRESRKRSKMLINQLEEKVEYEIIRIQEKEQDLQMRIGQSIHDDFAGTIAGVVHFLNVRALEKSGGQVYSQLAAELHKSYERARRYSHDLFEESQKDFWDQLVSSIQLFFIDSETTLNLAIDELSDHLSPEIKVTILLVIKEALTNILKHAKANIVEVTIYEEDQVIHLLIQDNGIGYPQNVKFGLGIHSIRKRVEDLGGNFAVYVKKGDFNTCLEIKIPRPLGSS